MAAADPDGLGCDRVLSDVQIWNKAVFVELRDVVGVTTAHHIVSLFQADLFARFTDADSRDALRRDAHAIKSTAGMLGFDELSDAAATLETDCQSGDDVTRSLVDLLGARRRADEALSNSGLFSACDGQTLPQARSQSSRSLA